MIDETHICLLFSLSKIHIWTTTQLFIIIIIRHSRRSKDLLWKLKRQEPCELDINELLLCVNSLQAKYTRQTHLHIDNGVFLCLRVTDDWRPNPWQATQHHTKPKTTATKLRRKTFLFIFDYSLSLTRTFSFSCA